MTGIAQAELIVGMEVHVELATPTKVFSRAGNPAAAAYDDAEPNTLVDPVILGLPGTLPVLSEAAVEASMLVGLALGCTVTGHTHWDRKSYSYPDLPKGYQISQYDHPLCREGSIDIFPEDDKGLVDPAVVRTIRVLRAHLEEDAGKLLHEAPGGAAIDYSIVDYNRAGTPLLEIVTEPDFRTADEAVGFARQLRLLCRHLGVSECAMQKGHIRFEPNINMRLTLDDGRVVKTPIVEVKNLNSFRSLRGAIEYEAAHQPERWEREGLEHAPGTKTTRGWDGSKTLPQRSKEDAHDYRYFPEPDLPPVFVDDAWEARVRTRLVEAPTARLARWVSDFGMDVRGALALLEEPASCAYFDAVVDETMARGIDGNDAGAAAGKILLQVGSRLANERSTSIHDLGPRPTQVAALIELRLGNELSAGAAEQVFEAICQDGDADPRAMAERLGLLIVRDEAAMEGWIEAVLAENAAIVDQIRAGKTQAVGRLIGAVMQRAGGAADAAEVRRLLLERIGA